jgi:hypothetical protein
MATKNLLTGMCAVSPGFQAGVKAHDIMKVPCRKAPPFRAGSFTLEGRIGFWRGESIQGAGNDRGVSLVIALLILLVLTLIGISAITTSTFETNIAGNERLYNEAFYSADAGIDYFYSIGRSFLPGGDRDQLLIYPNTMGTIRSQDEGLNLGQSHFNITWRVLRREMGPPEKIEFLVTSEGVVPTLPAAGRVIIEAVIEAVSESSSAPYPGGST